MCAGHSNRDLVICHQLTEKLSAAEHWKTASYSLLVFLVVRMNGSCIYDNLYAVFYIGSLLADENPGAHPGKVIGQRRLLIVRTADGKMFVQ